MKKINFVPEDRKQRTQDILCTVCNHPVKGTCEPDYRCEAYLAVKKAIGDAQ